MARPTLLTRLRSRRRTRLELEATAKREHALAQRRLMAARKADTHPRARLVKVRDAASERLEDRREQVQAIDRSLDRHDTPPPPKRSPRTAALEFARRYADRKVQEQPAGSNGGPYITGWQQHFGFGRVPWCGIFCGVALQHAGVRGVTSRIAGVALIEQDARARRGPYRGYSSTTRGVLPGDLAIVGGYGVHVELVVKAHGDGSAETIGGNTSRGPGGSQSNGGCVARRLRSRGELHGFALVDYP